VLPGWVAAGAFVSVVVVVVVSLGLQATKPTANNTVAKVKAVIRLNILNSLSKIVVKNYVPLSLDKENS
jgi:hypothetical protein